MHYVLIKHRAKLVGRVEVPARTAQRAIFDLLDTLIKTLILQPGRVDPKSPDAQHRKPPCYRRRGIVAQHHGGDTDLGTDHCLHIIMKLAT